MSSEKVKKDILVNSIIRIDSQVLHGMFNSMSNDIVGRIKTWADSTSSDPVQRKAIKDILSQMVWKAFWNENDKIFKVTNGEPQEVKKFPDGSKSRMYDWDASAEGSIYPLVD